MATKLEVTQGVVANFEDMRKNKKHQYSVYRINSTDSQIEVDTSQPGSQPTSQKLFDDFVEDLPQSEARYVIFDFRFINQDNDEYNKFLFILWCPDGASTREKELYLSSKGALRSRLLGVSMELFAAHPNDLEYAEIRDRVCQD